QAAPQPKLSMLVRNRSERHVSTNCATGIRSFSREENATPLDEASLSCAASGNFPECGRSFFVRLYLLLLAFIFLSMDLVAHRHSPIHLAFKIKRRPTMGDAVNLPRGIHNGKAREMLEKGRGQKLGLALVAAGALCLSTWTVADARPFGLLLGGGFHHLGGLGGGFHPGGFGGGLHGRALGVRHPRGGYPGVPSGGGGHHRLGLR